MNPYIVKFHVLMPVPVPSDSQDEGRIKLYERRPTGETVTRVSFCVLGKARVLAEFRAAHRNDASLMLAGLSAPVTADDFDRVAAELRSRQGPT